jgi:hypothetical protein
MGRVIQRISLLVVVALVALVRFVIVQYKLAFVGLVGSRRGNRASWVLLEDVLRTRPHIISLQHLGQ